MEHGVLQIKNIFSSGSTRFILNKDEAFKKTDSKPKLKSLKNQRPPLNVCGYSEELHSSLRRSAECVCRVKADNEHLEHSKYDRNGLNVLEQ